MKPDIKYITELTKEDLRQIAETVNIEGKDGIKVKRGDGKVEISIDIDQLRCILTEYCN